MLLAFILLIDFLGVPSSTIRTNRFHPTSRSHFRPMYAELKQAITALPLASKVFVSKQKLVRPAYL